ncbi:ROK family protein [Egibacter rhizosphaerae]|uniref:ROK family protein n=1 Tax=Egibacter rhizosphaerae TaxID=1670831 RepID=A0A411YF29_9ACTN|nr:ROK family protein [Egibacter rhizosphaerae]QBI19707.1 ROK family protein [Egibacter rhizosphaerae]
MPVAGVDLGGTNIAAAVVDDAHRIMGRARRRTPTEGPESVVRAITRLVGDLDPAPEAVGVGVPGPIREGVVQTAPNLSGWQGRVPVQAQLEAALGLPVVVDNDANVGALGEWLAGAGRGARFLLGVWLGTGIGAGLVLDGRPYTGAFGGAGEIGHVVVQRGGDLCGCGRRGCLEAYAGRAAMERIVVGHIEAGRETVLPELQAQKGKRRMTSGVWAEALERGDAVAVEVFDDAIDALGVALGGAVNLLDLDAIVVGGGVAEKLGPPLAERLERAMQEWLLVPDVDRRVVVAELGDDAGVIGAAALARERVLTA